MKEILFGDFPEIQKLEGLEIVGLMNMAPFGVSAETLKDLFEDVVNIKNELQVRFDCELKEVSMGMSGDYKEAVVAGATIIRIGRKLFSQ